MYSRCSRDRREQPARPEEADQGRRGAQCLPFGSCNTASLAKTEADNVAVHFQDSNFSL
jgi:hypothetical protein